MAGVFQTSFFDRDAVTVARALIGTVFRKDGVGGIIVEAEAYTHDDPASHSYRGRTPRNAPMFGNAGTAYVYRSYGLHWCMNIVCSPGGAVLLRALEPAFAPATMSERRGGVEPRLIASGPGRLCQALGIDGSMNGLSVLTPPFSLVHGAPVEVVAGPRIGISRATERPWRFGIAGSPFLSKRFSASARAPAI